MSTDRRARATLWGRPTQIWFLIIKSADPVRSLAAGRREPLASLPVGTTLSRAKVTRFVLPEHTPVDFSCSNPVKTSEQGSSVAGVDN
jgi:hypothetical protein